MPLGLSSKDVDRRNPTTLASTIREIDIATFEGLLKPHDNSGEESESTDRVRRDRPRQTKRVLELKREFANLCRQKWEPAKSC